MNTKSVPLKTYPDAQNSPQIHDQTRISLVGHKNAENQSQGTPQNLMDTLTRISTHLGVEWENSDLILARMHLKDFLAQKFGAAMLTHPEAEKVLQSLFNQLTG